MPRRLAQIGPGGAVLAVLIVLVGSGLAGSPLARAARVEQLHVDRKDKAYVVSARVHIDAPLGPAYAAATDFKRLPDYSTLIEAMHRLDDDKLASRMRLCVLWYCKTVRQVMRYRLAPPEHIDMQVVPGRGDLSAGQAHWHLAADGDQATIFRFQARIVPDFWVPPLIGPWAIARALRKQVAATATAIERLARHRPASTPGPSS